MRFAWNKMAVLAGIMALVPGIMLPVQASRLSDLVKQPPKVYLPARLIGEQSATFTIKAKPGQYVHLILSPDNTGEKMDDGRSMHIGKPVADASGVIPSTGVLSLTVTLPQSVAADADREFVAAVISDDAAGTNAQLAQILNSSGQFTGDNSIAIVDKPSNGNTLIVPGDPGFSKVLNSLDVMGQAKTDPSKANLLDNGNIDRNRSIDRNLMQQPPGYTGPSGF